MDPNKMARTPLKNSGKKLDIVMETNGRDPYIGVRVYRVKENEEHGKINKFKKPTNKKQWISNKNLLTSNIYQIIINTKQITRKK